MATLGSLDKLGVLFLENLEVPLGIPIPDAVGSEDQVHLLKSALVRLRVQRPDHGNGDDVGGGEDIVGVFLESLEHDGAEQSKPAISDRPSDHTPCVTLGTDFQWEDLSGIQPWNSEPCGTESGGEEEDHGNSAGAVCLGRSRSERVGLTSSGKTTSKRHGDTLDHGSPIQGPATTDAIEGEDTNEC